jgi:hypothetical protein
MMTRNQRRTWASIASTVDPDGSRPALEPPGSVWSMVNGGMRFRAGLLVPAFAGLVLSNGCANPAVEACRDLVQTFGDTAEDCGDDRAAVEEAVEDSFRARYGAGCGGVDRVRDIDDFYDVCIPFLETVSCEDYLSPSLPPECLDQLIYSM